MNENDTTRPVLICSLHQAILFLAPQAATITVGKTKAGRRKALARITGLTRPEFDVLPGRTIVIGHPDNPICWRKKVSGQITVETQEAPANARSKRNRKYQLSCVNCGVVHSDDVIQTDDPTIFRCAICTCTLTAIPIPEK